MTKYKCKIYILCLIGWHKSLEDEELQDLKDIFKNKYQNFLQIELEEDQSDNSDWIILKRKEKKKKKEKQKNKNIQQKNPNDICSIISKLKIGYYHSRIIFEFELKKKNLVVVINNNNDPSSSKPINLSPIKLKNIRIIRKELYKRIIEFFNEKVSEENGKKISLITKIEKILNKSNNKKNIQYRKPIIFIYPVFELRNHWRRKTLFKKSEGERPFSLQTTCFYTKLDDRRRLRDVKMRVSGSQIITTRMTKWFFNALLNIIFHEGLYRQRSDRKLEIKNQGDDIYFGLENRLEDFARNLLTIFHQYSREFNRRKIQYYALLLAIINILAGIFYYIL